MSSSLSSSNGSSMLQSLFQDARIEMTPALQQFLGSFDTVIFFSIGDDDARTLEREPFFYTSLHPSQVSAERVLLVPIMIQPMSMDHQLAIVAVRDVNWDIIHDNTAAASEQDFLQTASWLVINGVKMSDTSHPEAYQQAQQQSGRVRYSGQVQPLARMLSDFSAELEGDAAEELEIAQRAQAVGYAWDWPIGEAAGPANVSGSDEGLLAAINGLDAQMARIIQRSPRSGHQIHQINEAVTNATLGIEVPEASQPVSGIDAGNAAEVAVQGHVDRSPDEFRAALDALTAQMNQMDANIRSRQGAMVELEQIIADIEGNQGFQGAPPARQVPAYQRAVASLQVVDASEATTTTTTLASSDSITTSQSPEAAPENCSICTDKMPKDFCHVVPCDHKFCLDCLLEWIDVRCLDTWRDPRFLLNHELKKITCPLCRIPIAMVEHSFSEAEDEYRVNLLENHFLSWRAHNMSTRNSFADEERIHLSVSGTLVHILPNPIPHNNAPVSDDSDRIRYEPSIRPLASIPTTLSEDIRRNIENKVLGAASALNYAIDGLGPALTQNAYEKFLSEADSIHAFAMDVMEGSEEEKYVLAVHTLLREERTAAFRIRALEEQ